MSEPVAGPVGIGIAGTGVISDQYLETLTAAPDVRVHMLADLDPARALQQARRFGVDATGTLSELLAHPLVEIVVNLTNPASHVDVSLRAMRAGKHVWSEKPLASDRRGGRLLLSEARRLGVRIASAPDTLLGDGFQTARRLVDQGLIGQPLTATTAFRGAGPELWHPNPAFLYASGAGPLMDMGPYFISGLVTMFGRVESVSAMSSRSQTERRVASGPRAGETFPVDVPTHVTALIRFASGELAESCFSFQYPSPRGSTFEVVGSSGIVRFPDPNSFDGPVEILRPGGQVDLIPVASVRGRGVGVVDLARSLRTGDAPRASGELGYHVLDVLIAIAQSANSEETRRVTSSVDAPALLPEGWDHRLSALSETA